MYQKRVKVLLKSKSFFFFFSFHLDSCYPLPSCTCPQIPSSVEDKKSWWYPWLRLGAGLGAAMTSHAVTYPLDTIRRCSMVQGALGYEAPVPGISVWRGIVDRVGYAGLWRGWTVGVVRMAPMSLLHILTYDVLRTGAILSSPGTAPSL